MVTNPASGLRFDIYERVHLPDDAAAIDELEEIELVPHMQALKQSDQTVLKGHLLLTGIYRSTDRGSEKLEHWIPVEISLPPDRVQREVDLAVEIDNFDVDLLSTRSLNVTGVLALRGIQASQSQQQPVWRDDSFTVVHEAQAEAEKQDEQKINAASDSEAIQPSTRTPTWQDDNTQAAAEVASESSPSSSRDQETPADSGEAFISEQAESVADQAERAQQLQSSEPSDNAAAEIEWGDLSAEAAQPDGRQPDEVAQTIDNTPDKTDLKIAFGISSDREAAASPGGMELLSKMGADRSATDASSPDLQAAAEGQTASGAPPQSQSEQPTSPQTEQARSGDEIEWTRLFLHEASGASPFSTLKICIVQREDTLEDIAARYNVQPRELQLHNSLHDPHVSEGQVLYIPK